MFTNLKAIKFLILSDIHFGKLTAFPQMAVENQKFLHPIKDAVPMTENLIETVKRLGRLPDAILVLGDLTSIASPAEFVGSQKFVKSVASMLGINEKMVFFTFGNHDVDWRVCSLGKEAGGFHQDGNYNAVASAIGGLFVPNPAGLLNGPVSGCGVFEHDDFSLFIANSGHQCISDQDYRHGKLGLEQLRWLESEFAKPTRGKKWRVLMVHHHPFNYPYPTLTGDISTMEEGAELIALVGEHKIDVVCHGHRHHPKVRTLFENSWKQPATFFCAGSFGVQESERNHGQIPNLFHLLSLNQRLQNGGCFGSIQTFEYAASEGWRAIRNMKETPLDHVQWFGTLMTEEEFRIQLTEFLRLQANDVINGSKSTVMLPPHQELPVEFRCYSMQILNEMLKKLASEVNCKIIGRYPEDVALTTL